MSGIFTLSLEACWRITLTLVHVGWIGLVLAALAALGDYGLRRARPERRYAINALALLILGLSLPVAFVLVGRRVPDRPAAAVAPRQLRSMVPPRPLPPDDGKVHGALPAHLIDRSTVQASGLYAGPRGGRDWRRVELAVAPYVTLVYGCGVLMMLGRLVMAVGGGLRLRTTSRAVVDGPLAALLAVQARRLGLAAAPALGFCERIAVPVVLGLVRPMVLLPAAMATGLTPEELAVVLAHELAHLRRYDHWFILAQRGLEAVLFFHPAAWYLSRRIDREREHCCDDLVLAAGGDRLVYSTALLHVAELSAGRVPRTAMAADGRRPSELRRRIARLLQVGDEPAVKLTRVSGLAVALLVTLAGGTTAALLSADKEEKPKAAARDVPRKKAAAEPKPSITGRVLDVAGRPIPFALVGIAHKDSYIPHVDLGQTIGGALADADGRFALPPFDPGDYDVVPVPEVEIQGDLTLPEQAHGLVRKVASKPGKTRLETFVMETFASRRVTLKAGTPPVEVVFIAVPHVTFTARFIDSQGKPAPARPVAYPIYGELDGQRWSAVFQAVPGQPDTMIGALPKALKKAHIQNDSDNTWWTWTPGGKHVSPSGIRLDALDGDQPAIVVQRFKSNTLEIRLRTTAGALPTNPRISVYYPMRRGGDGGPIPKRVGDGVYRLNQMILPRRDCEVVVFAPGFKTASTRTFQFPDEGQAASVEVALTPGQSTDSWDRADAQPVVLRAPDGQVIAQSSPVKGPDRAITCRAIDKSTGRPVAEAFVKFEVNERVDEDGKDNYDTLDRRETWTDADGRFTVLVPERYLPDPAPKRVLETYVQIEHPNYVMYFDGVPLRELAEKGTSDTYPAFRTVGLVPARTVHGRLLDGDGQPFPNVTIYKEYPDLNTSPRDAEIPKTGADGRFRAKAPIGMPLKLEFRALKSARRYYDVAADATSLGDIRLAAGVRLKGHVFDDEGKPVPFISLTTPADKSDAQPNFVLTTDKDGRFETDELPPGKYTAQVGEFHRAEDGPHVSLPIKPAPALYLPVPFEIREGEAPPPLAVRPVPHVTFNARLTLPKLVPPRGGDQPAAPAEPLNSVAALQVKGTFQGAAWASRLSFLDISDDGKRCTVRVPKGLDDARIEFGDWPQRFRLNPGDRELFGPAMRLGHVESGFPSIELRRYRATTLNVTLNAPNGKSPADLKVQVHYLREPVLRDAGVVFEKTAPEPKLQDGRVHISVLPDEELVVTVQGAAPLRVKLTEGETRDVTIDLPAPK